MNEVARLVGERPIKYILCSEATANNRRRYRGHKGELPLPIGSAILCCTTTATPVGWVDYGRKITVGMPSKSHDFVTFVASTKASLLSFFGAYIAED